MKTGINFSVIHAASSGRSGRSEGSTFSTWPRSKMISSS
jgi:hypothetical protein